MVAWFLCVAKIRISLQLAYAYCMLELAHSRLWLPCFRYLPGLATLKRRRAYGYIVRAVSDRNYKGDKGMMDKAYCEKCGMEVDDLATHNQAMHGEESGQGETPPQQPPEMPGTNGGDMGGQDDGDETEPRVG